MPWPSGKNLWWFGFYKWLKNIVQLSTRRNGDQDRSQQYVLQTFNKTFTKTFKNKERRPRPFTTTLSPNFQQNSQQNFTKLSKKNKERRPREFTRNEKKMKSYIGHWRGKVKLWLKSKNLSIRSYIWCCPIYDIWQYLIIGNILDFAILDIDIWPYSIFDHIWYLGIFDIWEYFIFWNIWYFGSFAQVEQRQVMLGRSERLSRRLMRRQVHHHHHLDDADNDHHHDDHLDDGDSDHIIMIIILVVVMLIMTILMIIFVMIMVLLEQ